MKLIYGLLPLVFLSGSGFADTTRDRSFDDGWTFHRGDAPAAEAPNFDDSAWRRVDLPHDWSIEDLPARAEDDTPVLAVRDGEWLFQAGDDLARANPLLDDRAWQKVVLPAAWKDHSNYAPDPAYGWYRRHIQVPAADLGKDLALDLSTIQGADEVYFNGVLIGATGSFPPHFDAYWGNVYQTQRTYVVPAFLARNGDNVISVRIYSETGAFGGMYDLGAPVTRTGPFDPGASLGGTSTGHTVGGVGWYRKRFTRQKSGALVSLRFDGVYMNSDVWLNGHLLGNHPNGYTSFVYDLTPFIVDGSNVVSVRVRNTGKNSRWYSGSGIYRHVWLTETDSLHLANWGVAVTTLEANENTARIQVVSTLENAREQAARAKIQVRIIDDHGRAISENSVTAGIPSGERRDSGQSFVLGHPARWSPTSPSLYRAEVTVFDSGKVVDQITAPFGIRTVSVDPENGLRVNGVTIKLKGGNLHNDNGPLGSKAIDRAEVRRVELMKAQGFNAIRTSHNPPSPALLDAADRLGMLILDEAFDQWAEAKTPDDYHLYFKEWWKRDLESMVLRDRNHPSIVLWSIGNEIVERKTAIGAETARELAGAIRALDPTRPITSAYNSVSNGSDPYFGALDVAGYNYNPERYESDHARVPNRVILGTESYPKSIFSYWSEVEKMPWVIGDFVWTAVDYIGESGIGHADLDTDRHSYLKAWPWHIANCGDIDICGFKKPQSYYRDVVWGERKLAMAVHRPMAEGRSEVVGEWGWRDETQHWTWPGFEGKPLEVKVYSTYPSVSLFLNGKEIGTKPVSRDSELTATFLVPYAPGELKVVGSGESIAFRSAGSPARLRLTADRSRIRATRDDLAYVTVEVLDAAGERLPNAELPIRFAVNGPGEIAGVCNSNPFDTASFQAPTRNLYEGRALAVVRPVSGARPGSVVLSAATDGLPSVSVPIELIIPNP